MTLRVPAWTFLLALSAISALGAGDARGAGEMPPWIDADDVPLPIWVRSVSPRRAEVPIVRAPGALDARRGTPMEGARLPVFSAKRAPGCTGRWLEIGAMSWICSDAANFSADPPSYPVQHVGADKLPFHYYFVGKAGASGFSNLATAQDGAPEQELDPGWAIGATEERDAHGEHWVLTNHGRWIAARELGAAHPPGFSGSQIENGNLDVAWVVGDRVNVYNTPKGGAPSGTRMGREVVHAHETQGTGPAAMTRISADDETPALWMRARDLVRPTIADPPEEIASAAPAAEKWIDVDVATQTLVAFEGSRPVFATLVSTGKGAKGSPTATRLGVHRIWVKLVSTNMGNLENEDADEHYSIEDVPWVQFFDKAIALHGAFWHRDFGHVHSHGCVNLAPADAEWLFRFTGPHMPRGWNAVLPTDLEQGTLVRIR